MVVECIEDHERNWDIVATFLWMITLGRHKEFIKSPHLTKGKQYEIVSVRRAEYGNAYVPCTFYHVCIVTDLGVRQLYPIEMFKEIA